MNQTAQLRVRILKKIVEASFQMHPNNYAHYRFGPGGERTVDSRRHAIYLDFVMTHIEELAQTWECLEDSESRILLESLIVYRSMSHLHVKLARNTPEYAEFVRQVERLEVPGIEVEIKNFKPVSHKHLHVFHLIERQMRLLGTDGTLINLLYHRQYQFQRDGVAIGPEPGDVVLDCGACWGDSTMLFADMVGATGQVYAFEFVPENLDLLAFNLDLNPHLRDRVKQVPHAVGAQTGEVVSYEPNGSGSRLGRGDRQVEVLSIDDLVRRRGLERVDFIKMDVEGCEAAALRGAAETIARFKPRLAISAYHLREDFVVLPQLIKALAPEYRLYLDHHTIHQQETVLYARV